MVTRWLAPSTDGGRHWPGPENFDATLDVGGYAVEGFADADATQLRLSDLLDASAGRRAESQFHRRGKARTKRSRA